MSILLNVNNLEKSFAGKRLFTNLSFGINEQDRIGLVGPNGAGKSTLLKILLGQTDVDKGQVTKKRGVKIGFLGQSPVFGPDETIMNALMTINGNVSEDPQIMTKAYEWMSKLDLWQFGEDFLMAELSGGWQKRVALARELLQEPDLLFLDEPTNHLDVRSILWLEEFLQTAKFAFLVVTHDRLFLQRVTERILDLDPRNPNFLLDVNDGYLNYLDTKNQLLSAQQVQETKLKNTLRRETEWLRRGAKARQTKQKARIQAAGSLSTEVEDLTLKNRSNSVKIDFGDQTRSPKKLIETKGLKKSFQDRLLFENVNMFIGPESRIALMGDNGCGKSTLIRILLEQEKQDQGSIYLADKIKISYFEQNRETLDGEKSVLKNICPDGDYVDYRGTFIHVRSYLEKFLFVGKHVELPVSRLSGGEQARLRIAQMMLRESQVLILDEPTNDLDVDTLNVLEDSIQNFPGAVILVTHDRFFMDSVATQIYSFPEPDSTNKELLTFASYFQWEQWFTAQQSVVDGGGSTVAKQNSGGQSQAAAEASSDSKASTTATNGNKNKKLSFKEKFEYENMESSIAELEQQILAVKTELESSEVTSHAQKLLQLTQQLNSLQTNLEHKFQRWAELENKLK